MTPVPSMYTVVAIPDIHFNPLANPALFHSLLAADAIQWQNIFAAGQTANPLAPATFGADTNYSSLVPTLAVLKQNLGSSSIVLFPATTLSLHG
jgi:hypothetical protein